MINIILTAIISAFVCVGIDVLFSGGMLFGWIREGIENWLNKQDNRKYFELDTNAISGQDELTRAINADKINRKYMLVDLMASMLKPFVLCVYCFSSVYGVLTYAAIHNGITFDQWPLVVLNSVLCLPLVGFIHAKYTRYVG